MSKSGMQTRLGAGRRDFLRLSGLAILAGTGAVEALAAGEQSDGGIQPVKESERKQSKIVVGQVKVMPESGKLEANHKLLMDVLGEIAQKQPAVDVAITSEGFLDGYVSKDEKVRREDMVQYAIDPQTSPYIKSAAEWAKRNNAWLIYGCTRKEREHVYNTALIFDRAGRLVGWYDKLHLLQHDRKYDPGMNLNVYDSEFGLFGVTICADRRWPETIRTMALKGARVIFNPTYGMHNELNLCMMRTRAYESELLIVFTHPLQALITDPEGQVLLNDENPDHRYIITEIDLSAADVRRASESGHLRHRRPDVYKL